MKNKPAQKKTGHEGPPCPKCGSPRTHEIMYGLPPRPWGTVLGEVLTDKEQWLITGGCVVGPDNPRWVCLECKAEYGRSIRWAGDISGLCESIGMEYGLPRGSLRLAMPDGSAAPPDMRVDNFLAAWKEHEESDNHD